MRAQQLAGAAVTLSFWVGVLALGTIGFAWIGYPLLMRFLAALAPAANSSPAADYQPDVSVIVATRDDPAAVLVRVEDLLAGEYPAERLQLVVAVDAAMPTLAAYQELLGARALVVAGDDKGGKAGALNAGVNHATGAVLIFTDTFQRFAPDAIARLVASLEAGPWAAVSGRLSLQGHDRFSPIDAYWALEWRLRRDESLVHSTIGVSGSIWAMARKDWQPLPRGLILDDLFTPMRLVLQGGRIGFDPRALAFDARRPDSEGEYVRKVRTLTGNFQLLAWMPKITDARANPVMLQFLCHKLLRLATPLLLGIGVLSLGTAGWLRWGASGLAVLALVVATGTGILGALGRGSELVQLLRWGWRMQIAVLTAWRNGLAGRWDVWTSP